MKGMNETYVTVSADLLGSGVPEAIASGSANGLGGLVRVAWTTSGISGRSWPWGWDETNAQTNAQSNVIQVAIWAATNAYGDCVTWA